MKNRVVSSVCFVLLGVNLLSCGGRQKSAAGDGVQVQDSVIAQAMEKDIVSLAPLETGEVFLKDQDPFGEVVELKGQQIVEPDTFIFKTPKTGCYSARTVFWCRKIIGHLTLFSIIRP